jgi:hypothetical protein
VELNGQGVSEDFVPPSALQSSNLWDVYLSPPEASGKAAALRLVDVNNERALFGPAQPVWDETRHGGITVSDEKLVLHYQHSDAANVVFNIYRDGGLCAKGIRETNWTDAASGDYADRVRHYVVEAVDPVSGNASHLTPPRFYLNFRQELVIPAGDMVNQGGNLVSNHFENWGKTADTLATKPFTVARSGRYAIRAEFSNGAGPVNTGITCAVKKLALCKAGTDVAISSGYLVMPQSGDWKRLDLSSPVVADLVAGEDYTLRITEDDVSRNMSYLKNNERYTAWAGGGEAGYNYVNIAALRLVNLAAGR